jgi:hypothetical protein
MTNSLREISETIMLVTELHMASLTRFRRWQNMLVGQKQIGGDEKPRSDGEFGGPDGIRNAADRMGNEDSFFEKLHEKEITRQSDHSLEADLPGSSEVGQKRRQCSSDLFTPVFPPLLRIQLLQLPGRNSSADPPMP